MISVSDYMMLKIRGYDYDGDNDCIVERKDNGQFDRCRPLIECKMCSNVSQIDVIDVNDINTDIFVEKYAYTGRPLLVKNATYDWKAMNSFNFEFFRGLYEDLQSPVLDNEEEGCQFFAWNFKEFKNLQVMAPFLKIRSW